MNTKTYIIAITGGIGCGKTSVAKIYEKEGLPVIFTDDLAKEIMNNNSTVRKKLKKTFGPEIFTSDDKIDNAKLASIVFEGSGQSNEKLEQLNSIVHPAVIDEKIKIIDKLAAKGEELTFVESALVFEAGLEEGFDYIIVVSASESKAVERTMKRSGMIKEQAESRISRQMSVEVKKSRADFVIDNDGSLEELEISALKILNILKSII